MSGVFGSVVTDLLYGSIVEYLCENGRPRESEDVSSEEAAVFSGWLYHSRHTNELVFFIIQMFMFRNIIEKGF